MRRGGVLAGLGKAVRARQWPREGPLMPEKLVEGVGWASARHYGAGRCSERVDGG